MFVIETEALGPCLSNPCLNDGTCINVWRKGTAATYKCNCGDKYTGGHCETGNSDQINPLVHLAREKSRLGTFGFEHCLILAFSV